MSLRRNLPFLLCLALIAILTGIPVQQSQPWLRLGLVALLLPAWAAWRLGERDVENSTDQLPPWSPQDWRVVLLLLVLSGAVHLPGLDRWPTEVGWDEGINYRLWQQQLKGHPWRPLLFQGEEQMETLPYVIQGSLVDYLQGGLEAYRLPNALLATPVSAICYGLFRSAVPPWPAALASGLLAISPGVARQTRTGNPEGFTLPFTTAAALLLFLGITRRHGRWLLAAGLMAGAGCYFYVACWLSALALMAALLLSCIFRLVPTRLAVCFPGMFALAVAPLVIQGLAHPGRSLSHILEVSVLNGEVQNPFLEILSNLQGTGAVLAGAWRSDWIGLPLTCGLVSALIFAGIVELWFERKRLPAVAALTTSVLFIGQLPSVIVAAGFDSAEPRRFLVTLPFLFLLAALAWHRLEGSARLRHPRLPILLRAAFLLPVLLAWPSSMETWMESFQEEWRWNVTATLRAAASLHPEAAPVIPASLCWEPTHPVGALSPALDLLSTTLKISTFPAGNPWDVPDGDKPVAYLLPEGPLGDRIRRWVPGGESRLLKATGLRGQRLEVEAWIVPRAVLQADRGLTEGETSGTGFLYVPRSDRYRFRIAGDDKARLTVGGLPVPRDLPAREGLLLQEGFQPVEIRDLGGSPMTLTWAPGTDASFRPVPGRHLRRTLPEEAGPLTLPTARQGLDPHLQRQGAGTTWARRDQGLPRSIVSLEGVTWVLSTGDPFLLAFDEAGGRVGLPGLPGKDRFPLIEYDHFESAGLDAGPEPGQLYLAMGRGRSVWVMGPDGTLLRRHDDLPVPGILDISRTPASGGFAISPIDLNEPSHTGQGKWPELLFFSPGGEERGRLPIPVPGSMATGEDGDLYVVDILSEEILRINPELIVTDRYRCRGASAAVRLAVDPAGQLWVLDGESSLLRVLDGSGRLMTSPVNLRHLFRAGPADSFEFVDIAFEADGTLLVLYSNFQDGYARFRITFEEEGNSQIRE